MKNELIHGDCLEIVETLDDYSIDAVITDPPYGYLKHKLDAKFDHELLFPLLYQKMKKDSLITFFGRGELMARWVVTCCDLGFKFKEELIWHKISSSNFLHFPRNHEAISLLVKGEKKLNDVFIDKIEYDSLVNPKSIIYDLKRLLSGLRNKKQRKKMLDYLDFNTLIFNQPEKRKHGLIAREGFIKTSPNISTLKSLIQGKKLTSILCVKKNHCHYQHPTQKPVELMKQLIRLTTKEGDLVLDPFCGSGTTAIACLELGRNYICIEKDAEYYEIANKRISDWHNKEKDRKPNYELPNDVKRKEIESNGQLKLF